MLAPVPAVQYIRSRVAQNARNRSRDPRRWKRWEDRPSTGNNPIHAPADTDGGRGMPVPWEPRAPEARNVPAARVSP